MTHRLFSSIPAILALCGITLATARVAYADPAPQMTMQVPHEIPVESMAFSPDGSTVASSCGSLKLWDVKTGLVKRNLPEIHAFHVAYSPDGNTLACSTESSVELFEAHSGQLLRSVHLGGGELDAFLPDGNTAVTAGATVNLWDLRTGREERSLAIDPATSAGKANGVQVLQVPRDGFTAAALTMAGTIDVWNVASGSSIRTIKMPFAISYSTPLAISADGLMVAAASDSAVYVWGVAGGRLLQEINDPSMRFVAFAPDGSFLIEGSDRGKIPIKLRNPATGALIKTLPGGDTDGIADMALSPDGSTLAVFGWTGTLDLWDVARGVVRLSSIPPPPARVRSIDYSRDGREIVSVIGKRPVVWNSRTGRVIPFSALAGKPSAAACRPDGTVVVAVHFGNEVQIRNGQTGEVLRTIAAHETSPLFLFLSADSRELAAADQAGNFRVWNTRTGARLGSWSISGVSKGDRWTALFSPDDSMLAAYTENNLFVWTARTRQVHILSQDSVYALSFSPDGKKLVAAPMIWNMATMEPAPNPTGEQAEVFEQAFSPDGTKIAVATMGGVDIFNAKTGAIWRTLSSKFGRPFQVAFSPDGSRILTGSLDGAIRAWNVQTGALLTASYIVPGPSYDPKSLWNEAETGDLPYLGADYGWLTVTPAGYFDCSSRAVAEKYIRWTVGDTIYPADRFYDRFHRPDLVRAALATAHGNSGQAK